MPLVLTLEQAYEAAQARPGLPRRTGRSADALCRPPSPLYFAERLTEHFGGAKIYLKREDLNHTGAHKINNCLGQILLARRMGKTRIIAETGAGQHGVATATVCARFGLPCVVYMGEVDIERQKPNVFRMKLLGAEVRAGHVRLAHPEGRDERGAARLGHQCRRHFLLHRLGGGPASLSRHGARFPDRDRQRDARRRCWRRKAGCPTCWWPASAAAPTPSACSIPSSTTASVEIHGVEAAGHGLDVDTGHAASLTGGTPGVLHGTRTYLLQDDDGQILEAHSISAGLDYPGVGPEHAWLKDIGRVTYFSATDEEALDAFQLSPSSKASSRRWNRPMRWPMSSKSRRRCPRISLMVVSLSGRGDKDIFSVAEHTGEIWEACE